MHYGYKYEKPIRINSSLGIEAYVKKGENVSNSVKAEFYKRPNDYEISITSKVHPLYTAGGPEALLDGIKGTENWRKGDWQGYQGTDFEAIIDLKKPTKVTSVSAGFLQDARPWILFPKKVEVYVSRDGKDYKLFGTANLNVDAADETVQIKRIRLQSEFTNIKYVKLIAQNYGPLPQSHVSAGEPAYIFVDEITIE